jgi:hypothetical protein
VLTAEIVARGRRALGGRQRNGRGAGHQFDVLSLDVGPFAAGAAAAAAMLAARANDGRNGPFDLPIGSEPGVWRPTPPTFAFDPAPWVGNVRPFLVPSAAMIRSDPPNPLTSPASGAAVMVADDVESAIGGALAAGLVSFGGDPSTSSMSMLVPARGPSWSVAVIVGPSSGSSVGSGPGCAWAGFWNWGTSCPLGTSSLTTRPSNRQALQISGETCVRFEIDGGFGQRSTVRTGIER